MYLPFFKLIAVGAGELLLTFLLGYMTLSAFTKSSLKERLALAGACGIALQGSVAFLGFLTGFSFGNSARAFFLLATAALLAVNAALLLKKRDGIERIKIPSWLYLSALVWIGLLGIQLFVPVYSGAGWFGDWWMHYDISQIFSGNQTTDTLYFNRYTMTSRTPLFNLYSSYHLGLFGNQFSTYQLSSILPLVFLLTAIALLITHKRIALAFFLIVFNPFMNNQAIYCWPKILTALYVICGIYFYLKIRTNFKPSLTCQSAIGCGLSWGLAILSHPSAVVYLAAMIADNLWLHRGNAAKSLRQLSVSLLLMIAVLSPWVFWIIHEHGASEFLRTACVTSGKLSLFDRVISTGKNAVSTLFPVELIRGGAGFLKYQFELLQKLSLNWNTMGGFKNILRFYYSTLPGALTITMSCLLILGGFRRFLNKRPLQSLLPAPLFASILIIGFWGGCMLQPGFLPWRIGIAGESMTPVVILLILVGSEYLSLLSVGLRRLILLSFACEFFISRGLHLFLFAVSSPFIFDGNAKLKSANNLIFARDLIGTQWTGCILAMTAFLACSAVIIYRKLNK